MKSCLTGKDSEAGKDRGQEKKGQQRVRWFNGTVDSTGKFWEIVKDREACYAVVPGIARVSTAGD